MKALKARGTDQKTGVKVCGAYANFEDKDQVRHVIYDAENRTFRQLVPDSVEFCTGRTDKYGRDIYIGDKVRTKYGRICTVIWRSTNAFVGIDLEPVDQNEPSDTKPTKTDLYYPGNLEIIDVCSTDYHGMDAIRDYMIFEEVTSQNYPFSKRFEHLSFDEIAKIINICNGIYDTETIHQAIADVIGLADPADMA